MDFERTYSLLEISRQLNRPRTTLITWLELFREFIPTIGMGRSTRYKEEALEIFGLISSMKEKNEPNELIREVLRKSVKEITVIDPDDEGKPFLSQLSDSYSELMLEIDDVRQDMNKHMQFIYHQLQAINEKIDTAVKETVSREVGEATTEITQHIQTLTNNFDHKIETIQYEIHESFHSVENMSKQTQKNENDINLLLTLSREAGKATTEITQHVQSLTNNFEHKIGSIQNEIQESFHSVDNMSKQTQMNENNINLLLLQGKRLMLQRKAEHMWDQMGFFKKRKLNKETWIEEYIESHLK